MKFLEKDLEDIIFNTENELLQERGLDIYGKKLRQVNIGNYGVCDLISYERPVFYKKDDWGTTHTFNPIKVWELKKDTININTFLQCLNYVNGLRDYFKYKKFNTAMNNDGCVFRPQSPSFIDMCLVGRDISLNDNISYLPNTFNNISIYTYSYDVDGISFEKVSEYYLVNNGFKKKK